MRKILTLVLLFCMVAASAQDVKVIGPKRRSYKKSTKVVKAKTREKTPNTTEFDSHKIEEAVLPSYIPSDSKAADYYRSSMNGDAEAMCKLGKSFLYEENGVSKDNDKAFYWFKKASELNHPYAMAMLAECYGNGYGCAANPVQAFSWSMKSMKGGDPYGFNQLGYCYLRGLGTNVNNEEAFKCFLKSAELGNDEGQGNLAYMYKSGIGVNKDLNKGFYWYQKSAEQGNVISQYELGQCYMTGAGCDKNAILGFKWYMKSAEQKFPYAMFAVGLCYYNGIGISQNKDESVRWFKAAAENGIDEAQNWYEKAYKDTQTYSKVPQPIILP